MVLAIAIASAGGLISEVRAQSAGEDQERTALEVAVDEVHVARLGHVPQVVVVGNPLIADVVVDRNNVLLVTGRNYGTTNIIALDEAGREIAYYDVSVRTSGRNSVSLFRGTARLSLNCSPRCETELDVGDAGDHFDTIRGQVEAKSGLVQAQAVAQ